MRRAGVRLRVIWHETRSTVDPYSALALGGWCSLRVFAECPFVLFHLVAIPIAPSCICPLTQPSHMSLPTLSVFDSLSNTKRALVPVCPGHVGLYVCGVTVYDLAHIGHARVFVAFDVITRYLRHRGYDVTYVRNHTDVDDKIINRAAERQISPSELAQLYIDELDRDMSQLGCLPPTHEPRVSTHMTEIIQLIEKLIERGHAYDVSGDVFFSVDSYEAYGKLSRCKLDQMRAGERVAVDDRKRNPADFALWKSAKPGEPTWESPWGPGRPGWHIECSAMSTRYLGFTFDIHGGGKDLTFPHHENEIAQSECAHGQTYANNWMHVGLVNIDGEKMSKSLGNFWTVRDVLESYHAETIRTFMLAAHYRKPVAYGPANLDLARHRLQYLYTTREALSATLERVEPPAADEGVFAELIGALQQGMDDDFNTPVALAVITDAAKRANELLQTKKLAKRSDVLAKLVAIDQVFDTFAEIFGVLGEAPATLLRDIRDRLARQHNIDSAWVDAQIARRREAREAKDWSAADEIRDELAARHIELMDRPEGTTWRIDPPLPEDASLTDLDAGVPEPAPCD